MRARRVQTAARERAVASVPGCSLCPVAPALSRAPRAVSTRVETPPYYQSCKTTLSASAALNNSNCNSNCNAIVARRPSPSLAVHSSHAVVCMCACVYACVCVCVCVRA